ncbi:MAG: hypothetical protein JWM58_1176 [Rhizobium sp.]|nr:hypothetical protein [Rhizobium sp.]
MHLRIDRFLQPSPFGAETKLFDGGLPSVDAELMIRMPIIRYLHRQLVRTELERGRVGPPQELPPFDSQAYRNRHRQQHFGAPVDSAIVSGRQHSQPSFSPKNRSANHQARISASGRIEQISLTRPARTNGAARPDCIASTTLSGIEARLSSQRISESAASSLTKGDAMGQIGASAFVWPKTAFRPAPDHHQRR